MPVDASVWKDLASNEATSTSGTMEDAVQLIRDAFLHKKGKAVGTLLVLDAAQVGAMVSPLLAGAYIAAFGDAEREFGIREAWIVGPTVRSTIQLKA